MSHIALRAICLASSLAVLAACSQESQTPVPEQRSAVKLVTPADLVGARVGPGCEVGETADGSPSYATRSYTFSEADWSIQVTSYTDDGCTQPFFSLGIAGGYELGAPVESLPGVRAGDFYRDELTFTARSQAAIDLFNGAGCGDGDWRLNVAQDVGAEGCIGVEAVHECPIDYDIVGFVDGLPASGVRGGDMCDVEGRPAALQSAGLALGAPDAVHVGVTFEILAEYPNGAFLENLIVTQDNDILFTHYFDKTIVRVGQDGATEVFAALPVHPVSIVRSQAGFVVAGHSTPFTEFPAFTQTNTILRLTPAGEVETSTLAGDARFLNGLHVLPSGDVVVADSIAGVLWRVDPQTGETTSWLADNALAPDPTVQPFRPAANGVKTHNGALYVSSSSKGAIFKRDPWSDGDLQLFAKTGGVDDFIFGDDGVLYATTHGEALLKVSADGVVEEVFGGGCGGCTAIAMTQWQGRPALLVLTTGGLLEGGTAPARVLRVQNF